MVYFSAVAVSFHPECLFLMAQGAAGAEPQRRPGLLKDQVRLVRRKSSDRYEIVPIQDPLSFEKGFFIVIRACQFLAQKNDGIVLIGLAGPSGAGKTVFTEKILSFMPGIAVISMDDYNDSSRIVDGNFDGKPCFHSSCFFLKLLNLDIQICKEILIQVSICFKSFKIL